LVAYEQETVIPDLSASEIPELLGRYQKLGKRFNAIAGVSEHLNHLVDNAHRRNRELEDELSSLRSENLSLAEQLRKKEKSNQKLVDENERVLAEHFHVLGRFDAS
jgi:septal ring factor EnvC (AmiA/AmiB activator)